MSISPEDFASAKMHEALGGALEAMELLPIFWSDDKCAVSLMQGLADYFGSLINAGTDPEEARNRVVGVLLKFRNRILQVAMKRRFDPDCTPYGDGEPVREGWEKMNVLTSGFQWTTVTFAQIQRMIDIAVEKLREDLLFSGECTFDEANEENAATVLRELECDP